MRSTTLKSLNAISSAHLQGTCGPKIASGDYKTGRAILGESEGHSLSKADRAVGDVSWA